MTTNHNNRWSRVAKRTEADKQLGDPFEDPVNYTGGYGTEWCNNDNIELLLLCRDKSLNLDTIAAIMRRNKRIIMVHVHQIGIGLLKRLGHFEETPKSIDPSVLKYIMETFDIDDAATADMRKFAKRSREIKDKFDALMNIELAYLKDPSNYLELVSDPLAIQNQLIEQTIEHIASGVPTNIVGPLLIELIARIVNNENVDCIAEAINRPLVAIRHKLSLVATKYCVNLSSSNNFLVPRINDPRAFANLLVHKSLHNIARKYDISTERAGEFIVQMFGKYITQGELDAATKKLDKESLTKIVSQGTNYPIHEAATAVANEIKPIGDVDEAYIVCKPIKSRVNQEPKVQTNVASKSIHLPRFKQEVRDKQTIIAEIARLTEELSNFTNSTNK